MENARRFPRPQDLINRSISEKRTVEAHYNDTLATAICGVSTSWDRRGRAITFAGEIAGYPWSVALVGLVDVPDPSEAARNAVLPPDERTVIAKVAMADDGSLVVGEVKAYQP